MGGGGAAAAAAGGPATFTSLGCISPETLQVIQGALGFERTTPVQEAVIPLFCGNKDVAVDACTGSGKTLAFIVPVIEKLRRLEDPLKKHQVGAIVVSPTRELARQIHTVAQPFVDSVPGLTSLLLVGGSDPSEDVMAFKAEGANIIIGTPGRIDDVMKRLGATLDIKRLEVFVLDEADRLLDMGFKAQLDAIMARLPKQRRTGLFSATQTEAVQALARAGLRNPVRVNVAVTAAAPAPTPGKQAKKGAAAGAGAAEAPALQQKTPTGLSITFTVCEVEQKLNQLAQFLALHGPTCKVIVYCLTCACVDFYTLALNRLAAATQSIGGAGGGKAAGAQHATLKGVQVKALHGRMKQSAREATLEAFSKLPSGVLLATDLAARGLDIPEVHWVVQMDPPQDPAAFVHRVGRTARAGRLGQALVYLAPHERSYVDFLRLRKVPMNEAEALASPGNWDMLPLLRRESESDREMMEVGMKAFVSYVRGYKEHHCRFIFRVQDLPMGHLATAFGLLRLPHMPEVKRALVRTESGKRAEGLATCEGFTPSEVDPDTVAFKDKTREKQRQKMLKQREAQQQQQQQQATPVKTPNSNKKQQQQGGAATPASAALPESGVRLTAAKRRKLTARDEMDELDAEYKLLKKLKRGKLTEHEFDVATGLSSDEDDEESAAAGAAPNGSKAAGTKRRLADDDDSEDVDSGDGEQEQRVERKAGPSGRGGKALADGSKGGKHLKGGPRQAGQGLGAGGGKKAGKAAPALPGQQHLHQHVEAKLKRKKRRLHKQQQQHQAQR